MIIIIIMTDNNVINNTTEEQVITPWEVTSKDGINYMKLIDKFGCDPIDGKLINSLTLGIGAILIHTY